MAVHVEMRIALCFLFYVTLVIAGSIPHRRFEYKLGFKGPHLVQRDGTIPFWEHGGHAIASDESIRITPSLRSKKGYVWSKVKSSHESWDIEVTFRVSGRGRVGADGLAIWYTEEKGVEGPVFGSSDQWKGLAIFFDSFDNDGQHNNPYISAMVNDGTMKYDHNSDGSNQQIGGCLRDFRNKPFPVRVKVEYYNRALTVLFNNGMTNNADAYEMCLRVENVDLPKEGYFGVSGATGGLADDHDVASFITHSLRAPQDSDDRGSPSVSDEEKKKFEEEFEEYYKKLQKAKEEYTKEHPDQKQPIDDDKWFESQDERELKMIFEGQNQIHLTVRDLHKKLDEVIGRQERTLSQVSMMGQGGGNVAQQPGGNQQGSVMVDSIKRHEVDRIMNDQRDLLQSLRDLKLNVQSIQNKNTGGDTGNLGNTQEQQKMQDNINNIQNDVRTIVNRQTVPPCPPIPASNCVTPFYFMLFMAAQIAMVIGYSVYRSNKENAAKKFY